jgi:nitrogen fixation protein FixH
MPETTPTPAPPRGFLSRLLWPGIIFVMLGGQLLLMAFFLYLAVSDGSFAVEPDYYQKGLHWDATLAQRRENTRLGWSVAIEIKDAGDTPAVREVRCRLTDKSGTPLDGATVDLTAFPHARGNQRATVTLLPAGNGEYRRELPMNRTGTWEFRLVASRGPEVFTDTQLHDVYSAEEGGPWRP